MDIEQPYLSFVLAVRNDNYGGDFIQRLQNFITWNTHLLEKYNVSTEFVLVNWNPVVNNKSLEDSITWPNKRKHVVYRIIEVPNQFHREFCDDKIRDEVPLFEYLAKNTGIKRAKGQFVCSINPDIILNEQIVKQIAKKKLRNDSYYRANRLDFEKIKVIKNNSSFKVVKKTPVRLFLKGFKYKVSSTFLPLQIGYLRLYNRFRLFFHLNLVHLERYVWILGWQFIKDNAEFKYHCNVSGDFMLMSKKNWFDLGGHPENTRLALHTDALMVVTTGVSGLKEVVFPNLVYHQDHQRRYDLDKNENTTTRSAYRNFEDTAQKMIQANEPIFTNSENWGLANKRLKETAF